MSALLDAAARDEASVRMGEDWVSADPRLDVAVRWGDDVFRLFPGSVERPVADVERAALLADVLDDRLVERHGFGIGDYTAVTLHWVDHAVRAMAPAWPTGDRPGLDDEARLSAKEMAASARLLRLAPPAALMAHSRRAEALRWATVDAAQLSYTPGHPSSGFGTALAVRLPATALSSEILAAHADPDLAGTVRWWLPLAFVPEVWGYGVSRLARSLGGAEPAFKFAQAVAARARRALWRFGDVGAAPDLSDGPAVTPRNRVQFILQFGAGRALLVQVYARLTLDRPPYDGAPLAALDVVKRMLAEPAERVSVPMSVGTVTLPGDIELVPVLVLATAAHITAPQQPGVAVLALEDLLWIARTADADSDLFMFCRDLARLNAAAASGAGPRVIAWEAIDYWEWWRGNGKTFLSGAAPLSAMLIEPHWGEAEWLRTADQSDLERALATLGLPGLADTDMVEGSGDHRNVFRWHPDPDDGRPGPQDVEVASPATAMEAAP